MTLFLIALGALPFLLGGLLYQYMYMAGSQTANWFFSLAAFLLLAVWFTAAFAARRSGAGTGKVMVCLNLIPLLDLLLVAVQELVLGSFWPNAAGTWSSLFFLPMLDLAFALTYWYWSGVMFFIYLASFLLPAAASLAGCALGRKVRQKKEGEAL